LVAAPIKDGRKEMGFLALPVGLSTGWTVFLD
jgi:hypothetical protein